MTKQMSSRWMTMTMGVLGGAMLVMLASGPAAAQGHEHGAGRAPAALVEIVRNVTRPYQDVNVALGDGYGPAFGCISGPQEGAMGVHYINGALVVDGEVDATKPEALTYDVTNGRARLLGVEYIVDAATWLAHHPAPPQLEGQGFQFVGSPNRYGIPAFFELHVWAWRENPSGTFSDWNTSVSCDHK